MSKAWSEKNRATKPQNYTQKEDMITAHQANGTGPYMLKARSPISRRCSSRIRTGGDQGRPLEGNADG
jgi:hypothetical protein